MAFKDFYKVLGVAIKATSDEIKKAYRNLAKKHHPDVNQGSAQAEETFKKVSEAYDTLSNEKKRKAYDRERAYTRTRQSQTSSSGRGTGRAEYDQYDFSSGWSNRRNESWQQQDPFGGSGPQQDAPPDPTIPTRGFDLQFILDVPLVTVSLGGSMDFSYDKYVSCADCSGTGISEEEEECSQCNGKCQVVESTVLKVDIPPGLVDDYTLRIEKKGCDGRNGGPPGDLLLKIHAEPHPQFKRVKNDIYAKVSISQKLADEGGPLTIQTLDAERTIHVEDGTLTGEEIRLRGEGACFPWDSKRGDFIIKFSVSKN